MPGRIYSVCFLILIGYVVNNHLLIEASFRSDVYILIIIGSCCISGKAARLK